MSCSTYRTDLYYINKHLGNHSYTEAVVSPLRWWMHRMMVWRYRKMRGFNVLRTRT